MFVSYAGRLSSQRQVFPILTPAFANRRTSAAGSPLPAIGRRSLGGRRPTRRTARESGEDSDAGRETTSRPAPRPPDQTTRAPLAPSGRTAALFWGSQPPTGGPRRRSAPRACGGSTAERSDTAGEETGRPYERPVCSGMPDGRSPTRARGAAGETAPTRFGRVARAGVRARR